ncbi:MAG: IS30 family transposase [bacterium]|nr:IS30 family transposase [bacterium]
MACHLTFPEREILYRLLKAKRPKSEIAKLMGRDRSTIYREIERNTGGRGYRPKQAQRRAEERRLRCRREPKLSDPKLRSSVTRLLKKAWSPDQIAGRLQREFPRHPEKRVSHQTIYAWIASEAPELRSHLRRGGKRRSSPEKRGRLVGCVSIEGRPKSVDSRRRFGDWEGDTVVSPGRRSGLVTMVDRKSGYARIRKTSSLKAAPTRRAACRSLRDLSETLRRTMTLDNGKEFAEHGQLAEDLELDIYFAKPYASWQRGTNENTNGLLRQFFPKGTDFARISHYAVARAEKLLNERPRKRLDYRTPQEVLAKECAAIGT